MINFDNSATTYPKPVQVIRAVGDAMTVYGGNPSRGGHRLSLRTGEAVFAARKNIADFFGASPENVIFTLNCTHALNFAIKGVMNRGGHVIISSLEHNSVSRPVFALSAARKASFSVAEVFENDERTIENFKRLIKPQTRAVIFTLASNVTGQITPYRQIAEICQKHNICFIADGAQLCGTQKINLSDDGINILCTAGHKGLYGPPGTGLLITDGKYPITPIIEGGTGTDSGSLVQTGATPEVLESGTVNTCGIIGLSHGVDFVKRITPERIFADETALCDIFISGIKSMPGFIIYREESADYAPIVSFNYKDMPAEKLASLLDENGICMRAGLHCAALAHNSLGTKNGTVRFAPSVFNKKDEVYRTLKVLGQIQE